MFANEGRLLKKSFFGLLILALACQTGEFDEVVRQLMVDAYLAVSVFVGFTLIVFIGLDSLTNFDIGSFLDKTKKLHVPIASFLGAIPGCGGAIIVVTQYIQGRISFGSLVAVLTATMGDAAFLILAMEPSTGLLIFFLGAVVGTISGYLVDMIHGTDFMVANSKIEIEFEIIVDPVVVIPDILSKNAFVIEKSAFENIKGKEPKTAILNQDNAVKRNACCKFNFLS